MRLTADLIRNSLSYLNPLNERELDLRGHKIPIIENLGVAGNYQECIDFTDNDIAQLGNFPLSPRLHTLLLARNRVSSIQPSLYTQVPNLQTLVLTQNRIAALADLEPLGSLEKLTHLTILENPVVNKENYRLYLIARIPTLRTLDFQRIRDAERALAKQTYGTRSSPNAAALQILSQASNSSTSANLQTNGSSAAGSGQKIKLTAKERKRFEDLLKNAKTLREIERLERDMAEGRIPNGVVVEGEE